MAREGDGRIEASVTSGLGEHPSRAGRVFGMHCAVIVLLHQLHVIAPEVGDVLQHLVRITFNQRDAVHDAMLQDQLAVAGEIDVHDLNVGIAISDVVML